MKKKSQKMENTGTIKKDNSKRERKRNKTKEKNNTEQKTDEVTAIKDRKRES